MRHLRRTGDQVMIAAVLNVLRNIHTFMQFTRQFAKIDFSSTPFALSSALSTTVARRVRSLLVRKTEIMRCHRTGCAAPVHRCMIPFIHRMPFHWRGIVHRHVQRLRVRCGISVVIMRLDQYVHAVMTSPECGSLDLNIIGQPIIALM